MSSLENFCTLGSSKPVACPFFLPIEKLEGEWPHPRRLPLGCGWSGRCTAPGHQGEAPSEQELREFCNLGYAQGCAHLPREREWDSVRFGTRSDRAGGFHGKIQILYVCERDHLPREHGVLMFDSVQSRWERLHRDACVQRMAECFLQSYLEARKREQNLPPANL